MMRKLRLSRIYLVAAIFLAVLSSFMLYGYLRGLERRVARSGKIVLLPVAGTDIAAGRVICPDMIMEVEFPDIYLLPTMISRADEVVERVALKDISAGDPFLRDSLCGISEGGRAALLLEPGRRAYPVDPQDNVVPLEELRAGDRVDVIFIPPEGTALTILHSAMILCMPPSLFSEQPADSNEEPLLRDSALSASRPSSSQILLSVAPEEAETLAEAEERGRLVLSVCPAQGDRVRAQ